MAGVSIGTVDRVLHNRGEVRLSTRNRILEIIRESGYQPNMMAKILARNEVRRIAVLLPESSRENPYWSLPLNGMEQAAREVADLNFFVEYHHFSLDDPKSFQTASRSLTQSNPHGVIVAPVFPDDARQLCEQCQKQNLPVVLIDSNLPGNCADGYYGQNGIDSGYLAGKLMCLGLKEQDQILIVNLARPDGIMHHLVRREEGFRSYFRDYRHKKQCTLKTLNIDISQPGEPDRTLSEHFNSGQSADGVFVTSSRSFKIASFLSREKLAHHILLIGYDLIPQNCHHIRDGSIDFLISQKPEDQGYRSVKSLFNLLVHQQPIATEWHSPIDIVTKENIAYYLDYESHERHTHSVSGITG